MVYYQNFYGIELSTYKALDRFYMFFITIMALFGELYNILIFLYYRCLPIPYILYIAINLQLKPLRQKSTLLIYWAVRTIS